MHRFFLASIIMASASHAAFAGPIISPTEDVMTSAFFFSPNFVRGFAGETSPRAVHRVSSDNAFGVGPETVYIAFDPTAFAGLTAPIEGASLTVQSVSGGFGADAGPADPFIVSAHGVSSDPIARIVDDTNPGGDLTFTEFFADEILPANPAALTTITSFGAVEFDITALVNDWIAGVNTEFFVALTATNDPQIGNGGSGYLHGFVNNSETPGSTFLTITVPEPSSILMVVCAGLIVAFWMVRPVRCGHGLH